MQRNLSICIRGKKIHYRLRLHLLMMTTHAICRIKFLIPDNKCFMLGPKHTDLYSQN